MKRERVIAIFLILGIAIGFGVSQATVNLSPGAGGSFGAKSSGLESASCFDALDKLESGSGSLRDINNVRDKCSDLTAIQADRYAMSQGVVGGVCEEPLADITEDGIVDFADVLYILANWGCTDCGDIDGDGMLGFGDILVILANWGCDFSGGLEECEDMIDNDDDGWTDLEDYGCISGSEEDSVGPTQCSNQIDDDGDSEVDGHDFECMDWEDDDESSDPKFPTICGNGLIEGAEECDDGDDIGIDGCSRYCQVEAGEGWECSGEPSICMRNGRHQLTLGEQRTAFFVYYDPADPEPEKTIESIFFEIFDETNEYSINSYFIEGSNEKYWWSGNVYGWYPARFKTEVVAMADDEIDYTQIDRFFFIKARTDGGSAGIGSPELVYHNTDEGRIGFVSSSWSIDLDRIGHDFSRRQQILFGNTGKDTIVHEVGHTHAMPHLNNLDCGAEVTYRVDAGETCSLSSGEAWDPMSGSGAQKGLYNSLSQYYGGWLDSNEVIDITQSGDYTIYPLASGLDSTVYKLPRARCPAGEHSDVCGGDGFGEYYLEFRRFIGHDRPIQHAHNPNIDGLAVRIDGFLQDSWPSTHSRKDTVLLDMKPSDPMLDFVLEEGSTYVDPHRNTELTVTGVFEDRLEFSVDMPNGFCGDGVLQSAYGEECDDGNVPNDDGCTSWCTVF